MSKDTKMGTEYLTIPWQKIINVDWRLKPRRGHTPSSTSPLWYHQTDNENTNSTIK